MRLSPSACRVWIISFAMTFTTYTLLMVLPKTATFAASEKVHCLGYRRRSENVKDEGRATDGNGYTSKFLSNKLSTMSVLWSDERAAFPLNREGEPGPGSVAERWLTLVRLMSSSTKLGRSLFLYNIYRERMKGITQHWHSTYMSPVSRQKIKRSEFAGPWKNTALGIAAFKLFVHIGVKTTARSHWSLVPSFPKVISLHLSTA